MIPVNGAPLPDRDHGVFWVEQLPAGTRQKWRIFSPSIWGVFTHFSSDNRTSPCYRDHTKCAGGHDPTTLRWKGYVHGWCFDLNRLAFLQLTDRACRLWSDQLGPGDSLRGMKISVSRSQKRNGRLTIATDQYDRQEARMSSPPDQDPRASLYNLWKLVDPGWKWSDDPVRSLAEMIAQRNGCLKTPDE